MNNADYTDDLMLLPNAPAQAEFLEQAVGGIGLHVNANKTEYICFKPKGAISTFSGKALKLIDPFTYLSSKHLIY